jgi:5-methyltetrahydropteroyltriglutamate--homocysteine methyltransferase
MTSNHGRILVSHAGVLPRPPELQALVQAGPYSGMDFRQKLPGAVKDVVHRQAKMGIDIVNDGEFSKTRGFSEYARDRLNGLTPSKTARRLSVMARDAIDFPGFIGTKFARFVNYSAGSSMACTGPISYFGATTTQMDIANFRAALAGLKVEGFLPSIAPGTIEHWLHDEYYNDPEKFVFAIADAMAEEYKAITSAGFLIQIDDPDLPDGWQMFPDMTIAQYRKYAAMRVEALNHALKDVPEDMIRFHICWGSNHGPHKHDIPFEAIVDLMLKVKAGCYSFEYANPRHDHEWRVWEKVKLPEGKTIMPGVVGHATDIIEHPQTVADRLIRFANLVGRDNVIAGTDCGLGWRVGHPEVVWAKLEALVEGARIASKELWRTAKPAAGAKPAPAKVKAKLVAKPAAKAKTAVKGRGR